MTENKKFEKDMDKREKYRVNVTIYCSYCQESWSGYMDLGDDKNIRCPRCGGMVDITGKSEPFKLDY